jgi:hypothetical protein
MSIMLTKNVRGLIFGSGTNSSGAQERKLNMWYHLLAPNVVPLVHLHDAEIQEAGKTVQYA